MQSASIIQVVSGFKPAVDGMGDFARLLGDALWSSHQIRSHFVVYKQPGTPLDGAAIAPNTVSYPVQATPDALLNEFHAVRSQQSVHGTLLHYGPYGYSATGNPGAFSRAIEQIAAQVKVQTFFHETYASGPPWKRAFWTHREQRQSLERLQRASVAAFTSNAKYMSLLGRTQPAGRPLTRIPIFSNMGEPKSLRPLAERKRQLIVFGQFATRLRLYKAGNLLEDLCRRLRIESVVDVGAGSDPAIPAQLAGAAVRRVGFLDEAEVSALLAESIAGVVGYWPDVWEKSGVVAAYEAHGVLPILVPLEKRLLPRADYLPYVEIDDLKSLCGTADAMPDKIPDAVLQPIVDKSYAYYHAHQSVERCAETIAESLLG